MNHVKWVVVALLSTCLVGCAAQKRMQPFNEAEFAPFLGEGHNQIDGQISGADSLGKEGSIEVDNTVCLTPVTAYTREWYVREIIGKEQLEPPDPRLKQYQRTTKVDKNGDYHFEQLQPGDYYVTGTIRVDNPFNPNDVHTFQVHAALYLRRPRVIPSTHPIGPSSNGLRL